MPTSLGQFVRSQRQFVGLTQEQLAARVGCDQTYISQLERGKVQRLPGPALVLRLVEALNTSPEELFRAMGYLGIDISLEPLDNRAILARILQYTEQLDLPPHQKELLVQDIIYLRDRIRMMEPESNRDSTEHP